MTAAIELHALGHVHGARTPWARRALEGIELSIDTGERVLVVGANGSGKSTLAWILAGLTTPTEGTALLGAEPLTTARDHIGMLVQHTRLQLLRPTVGEELRAFTDPTSPSAHADGLGALYDMGFEIADISRRIDDLSVGQQRRVALAAQLARRSDVLILDEPMAGLDRAGRLALVKAVEALPTSAVVVTVTHDLDESARLGDRVVELRHGRLLDDRPVA